MIASTDRTKNKRNAKRRRGNRALRFTPYAWAKLLYLRNIGPTEVGGFGISNPNDLLLVEDVQLVQQDCTSVSVEFDDDSVADFFDRQVDLGRQPEEFARIWIHTHPGASPEPSGTDEETFDRCFGGVDWAVMFILAREGSTYARARFNIGPGTNRRLRCRQDYESEFPGADHESWLGEYHENVFAIEPFAYRRHSVDGCGASGWWEPWAPTAERLNDRLLGVDR